MTATSSSASDVIVDTNVAALAPGIDIVSRPRLLRRMDEARRARLTLLSAPAGSGKTTLVREWAALQTGRVVEISLTRDDNSSSRFWYIVTTALVASGKGERRGRHPLLTVDAALPPDEVLASLAQATGAMRNDTTLVFDNYQVITDPSIHASMAAFIERVPPHVHLVIATRADPPLPISRLRGQGLLVELRASELQLTAQECSEFLHVAMGSHPAREGRALSHRDAETLYRRTEGWAAGLRLAALALAQSDDMAHTAASFGGNHPYLVDYFADEVLGDLPEEVCTFVVQTSIAQTMCANLCEAITGRRHGQAMLRRLRRANLFLVALDQQSRWYRYHHCFAEMLAHRLEDEEPELVTDLHRRAMRWYLQRGLMRDVVHHALAAGEYETAADAIEGQADELIWERGEIAELLEWLKALPVEVLRSRPRLCLAHAWALALTGQLRALDEHLAVAEQSLLLPLQAGRTAQLPRRLPQLGDDTLGEIAAVRAIAAGLQIDTARLDSWSLEAVAHAPESRFLRSVLALSRGRALDIAADIRNAMAAYAEAKDLSESIENPHILAVATSRLAELWALQGELHQAAATHRSVLRMADQQPERRPAVAAMSHVGLGGLLYEWNDVRTAARHFEQGRERASAWGHLETLKGACFGLARVKFAQGLGAEAFDLLEETEAIARHSDAPRSIAWVHAMQARLNLAQGNIAAAVHWSQTAPLDPAREPMRLFTGEYTTLIRLRTAEGRYDEALAMLDGLFRTAITEHWLGLTIELLVLQALALQARGSLRPAMAPLRKALALAAPEGFVRTFLDEGASLAALLGRAASQGSMPPYHDVVLAAFTDALSAGASARPSGAEVLTRREREVLRHIAAGESNQEIAYDLVLTVATVKRHASNIFFKLGVTNRMQAVARARQRGLL